MNQMLDLVLVVHSPALVCFPWGGSPNPPSLWELPPHTSVGGGTAPPKPPKGARV